MALALLVYVLTLIITAPASLLNGLLTHLTHGQVELANVQGTVWQGAANPVWHTRSGTPVIFNQVHWAWRNPSWLAGQLNFEFRWEDDERILPTMTMALNAKQIELRQIAIPLPGQLLAETSDYLKPAQLNGKIYLNSDYLQVNQQGLTGHATADWLNATSVLSPLNTLGNYHLDFASLTSGITILLSTRSGDLILNGEGSFSANGSFNLNGTAQAAKDKEESLRELLNNLAPSTQAGVRNFSITSARS